MLGAAFFTAIIIGLIIGLIPGLIGLISAIVTSLKREEFSIIGKYFLAALIVQILMIILAKLIFACGSSIMYDANDLGECFYLYIYYGASPGISLFMGFVIQLLLPKKKEKN